MNSVASREGKARAIATWFALVFALVTAVVAVWFGVTALQTAGEGPDFDLAILLRDGGAAATALFLTYAVFAAAKARGKGWFWFEVGAIIVSVVALCATFGGWGEAAPGTLVVGVGLLCSIVLTLRSLVSAGPHGTYFPRGH